MGCSYDILGARIRPEHKKQFIKMFNKILKDEVKVDNELLIDYANDYLKGTIGEEYAKTQGRITILKAADVIDPIVEQLDEANAKLEEANAKLESANAKLAVAEYGCTVKVKNTKTYSQLTWNT